ncbi:hypothetical protein GRI38_13865 [Altererythrobacter aurantiacus]|uniref:Uncharacterized protein n=1 Tax=Parapontixanthobacter aurantiacus TaxID=1463599 RepID=A0A844ZGX8_9SPHN|nr:hypothetical protein [Parapontixanthobacter aurantiacus]MXO87115.1 hypothetical protein [Parapontixanthobacter aurantiacus]
MDTAEKGGMLVEASRYPCAILEDRLTSMLRNSGGQNGPNGKPIRMMESKIKKLKERAKLEALLAANFPEYNVEKIDDTELGKWKLLRNDVLRPLPHRNRPIFGNASMRPCPSARYLRLGSIRAAATRGNFSPTT